jgi:hypothetical protein
MATSPLVDNRAVTAADFTPYSITAPTDSRLPGGGGNVISGLYDVNPAKFGITDNITTFSKNFGKQVQMFNGVGLTLNARMAQGVIVQGGVDIGRITQDVCDIRSKVPEYSAADPYSVPVTAAGTVTSTLLLAGPTAWHRHTERPQTQIKLLGSYTVPWAGVQVGATLQSIPGRSSPLSTPRPLRPSRPRSDGRCPATRPTCRSTWLNPGRCMASGSIKWTSAWPGRSASAVRKPRSSSISTTR